MGSIIVRPVTPDRMAGYDEFNQFIVSWRERDHTVYAPMKNLVGERCPICLGIWANSAEALRDQIHWALIGGFVHESCLVRHIGFIERQRFSNALVHAQYRFTWLEPIENRYWPKAYEDSKKPFYQTTLREYEATLVIGRRKRVDELELTADGSACFDIAALTDAFAEEDVTKSFSPSRILLHAWIDEKLREYLTKLKPLLPRRAVPLTSK